MFFVGQTVFELDTGHSVLVMGNDGKKCWVFDPFEKELILKEVHSLAPLKKGKKLYFGKYIQAQADGLAPDKVAKNRDEIGSYLISVDKEIINNDTLTFVE